MLAKSMSSQPLVVLGNQCSNCKGACFFFSGIQRGYGFVPDMELWTCEKCGSTFSNTITEILSDATNEL